ncbi:MAG: hypothetical protein EOP47_19085 [Sphingobacteriaceae bacterium]|nr:MAG: hypothetical protein EOP47_19085 [Sphingobacteriaceae bacterium]
MKTFTLSLLGSLLILTSIVKARDQAAADTLTATAGRDSLYKNADFEQISANVFSLHSTAPQTGILLDFSKKPTIKGSVPIYQRNMSALFVEGSVTSNNDFVPLFERGKWAPNASAALSYTVFIDRDSRYSEYAKLSSNSYVSADQIFWAWINAKGGYNLSSYLFYREDNTMAIDRQISRNNYKSLFGQVNFGFYLAPFKQSLSWLNISGNAGFEYMQHDNNYAALQTVRVKSYNKVAAVSGIQELEVTSEETSAKQGHFILANSANLNYSLTFLINSNGKYIFGLNAFGKTRLTQALRSTDLGFGVSVPVRRKKNDKYKTIANLALNYEVIDVGGKLNSNAHFSDKGLLGLTLAIPVYTLHYGK